MSGIVFQFYMMQIPHTYYIPIVYLSVGEFETFMRGFNGCQSDCSTINQVMQKFERFKTNQKVFRDIAAMYIYY